MIWKRPKQYGLETKKELEETGFTKIKRLLKLDDEKQIFSCCNHDVYNENLFFKIVGDIAVDGKLLKGDFKNDALVEYNEINFVLSNYEGNLRAISFSFRDLIKVKKQVLFDKLK